MVILQVITDVVKSDFLQIDTFQVVSINLIDSKKPLQNTPAVMYKPCR